MAGFIIQANGTVKFEVGLKTGHTVNPGSKILRHLGLWKKYILDNLDNQNQGKKNIRIPALFF